LPGRPDGRFLYILAMFPLIWSPLSLGNQEPFPCPFEQRNEHDQQSHSQQRCRDRFVDEDHRISPGNLKRLLQRPLQKPPRMIARTSDAAGKPPLRKKYPKTPKAIIFLLFGQRCRYRRQDLSPAIERNDPPRGRTRADTKGSRLRAGSHQPGNMDHGPRRR